MTRDEMLRMWAEIQRLEGTGDAPDRVHAMGLIDDLCNALDGKVLRLDDGNALYECENNVVVAEIMK